jgi:predicted ATPase/class 3 adenylate cyclase
LGDDPQAYLPGDRRRALAAGRQLADRVSGSALFADISGFTPLTEALAAELGPRRGAEELTVVLDAVFTELLDELARYGGEAIYFSGDAITAWIDGDDGMRGIACGLAMQQVIERIGLRTTPTGREVRIGLKVAVSVGRARRFVVGDPQLQRIDVLAGALMDRLAAAGDDAQTGDVLVDGLTAAALGDRVRFGESRGGAGTRVVAGLAEPVPPSPPLGPPPQLAEHLVQQWVLPEVYERIAGGGEFLTELRPGVPLFLKFEGIDYDDDPDAIQKLDEFITAAQRAVAANGGNVLVLTIGDKGAYLFAVFGAPIAHQDDAARACASALELHGLAEHTAARNLRIGIASGGLLSGSYGHPERRVFTCLGDVCNLAARLMSAAEPGGTLATAEIRRAAGADFEWATGRELRVKGKAEPVAAAPLLARVEQQSARPTHGTVYLGRDRELATIEELGRATADGHGRLVAVTGPPGTGKSRLLAEAGARLRELGVRTRHGAPRSYGAPVPYDVWRDIARDAWHLPSTGSIADIEQRLTDVLAAADPALLPRLPLLGPLAGVTIPDTELTATFDAKLRKTSLEALIVDVLEASASRGPVAFLVDAAEHLDELSWDLLEAIARAVHRLPVLVVIAHRDSSSTAERLAALPQMDGIALGPLDDATSRQLVAELLRAGSGASPAQVLVDRIAEVGAGNAFHLEELVNHVLSSGGDPTSDAAAEFGLPASVQSLQLARIDALPETPRRTVKVSSVVGQRFDVATVAGSYPVLGPPQEVSEHVAQVVRAALVTEADEERNHAFRSLVTRQVAYETLTFRARAELHDRVGTWLEHNTAGGEEAIVDVLAYHARNGTDPERARRYLLRAGIAAQERYANEAAADYYTAALPLVPDEERAELLGRLGKVQEVRGQWQEAEQTYQQAAALCEARGDAAGLARARTSLAEVARKQGRFADAEALLDLAQQTFAALDDRPGLAEVLHLRGTLASQQSHYAAARESYLASMTIRRELGDDAKVGALLSNLGVVAEQDGDSATARTLTLEALEVRQRVGDKWAIAVSRNNLGMIALLQEAWAGALEHVEESMRLANEVGDMWVVAVNQHNLGIAQRGLGDVAAAGTAYLAALQAYVDYDDRWSLVQLYEDVAYLALDVDEAAVALRLVGAADALRRELDAPRPPAPAQLLEAALASATEASGSRLADERAAGERLELPAVLDLVREVCRT